MHATGAHHLTNALSRPSAAGPAPPPPLALAPDLLLASVRRLRLLAIVLLGMSASGAIVSLAFSLLALNRPSWLDAGMLSPFLRGVSKLQVIGLALGGAMIGVTRSKRLAPERILAVGVVFQILGAFVFSAADYLIPWPTDQAMRGLPCAAVWLMAFPLVPSSRRRSAIAAFGAAATGPAVFALFAALGRAVPAPSNAAVFYLPLFGAAVVTSVVSRVVHGFAVEASNARKLGSYSLVEKIAEGGMGEVWRARHASLIRPAAVKLLRPDYLGNRSAGALQTVVRRFEREAQATALLSSPHTVALYDFGRTYEGVIYYVMELLGGLDLQALVRRFGPLPAERAAFILDQVCHSLADAHRVNLIHRDIKPANIQLTVRGPDFDFVKVLDFGLVKRGAAHAGAPSRGGRPVVGTAAYLSPETALSPSDVDSQSDIYSLGCAAYYLLSGQLVFDEPGSMQMIHAHVHKEPVPVSRRTELPVPTDLEELVHAMLAKDPLARPMGAAEVRRRLAAIVFPKPWTQERAANWWRTHLPDEVAGHLDGSQQLGGTIEIAAAEARGAAL